MFSFLHVYQQLIPRFLRAWNCVERLRRKTSGTPHLIQASDPSQVMVFWCCAPNSPCFRKYVLNDSLPFLRLSTVEGFDGGVEFVFFLVLAVMDYYLALLVIAKCLYLCNETSDTSFRQLFLSSYAR